MSQSNKKIKLLAGVLLGELTEVTPRSSLTLFETQSLSWSYSTGMNFILSTTMLFDDEHTRMPGFHEEWIDKYLETDFYSHFRMTRVTFHELKNLLEHIFKCHHLEEVPVNPLISLWYLSKGCTYNVVADRFNVSTKSVYIAISKILTALNTLSKKVIKWPSESESIKIERQFRSISGFTDKSHNVIKKFCSEFCKPIIEGVRSQGIPSNKIKVLRNLDL